MTLAVGVPCYNAEKTLPNLLASVKAQILPKDLEVVVILISDGDDKEGRYYDIAVKYDIRFITSSLKVNGGPGLARAEALSIAITNKYDLITFIDADDVFSNVFAFMAFRNGFNAPDVVEVYTPFLQRNDNDMLVANTEPTSPWVFGKCFLVPFLKDNEIQFTKLRAMEDSLFCNKVFHLAQARNLKVNISQEPTYIWNPGSEHSITRMTVEGNPIPIYNYGLCQVGSYAAFKGLIEFLEKKAPFSPQIKVLACQMMITHYFTYYESLQNYDVFSPLNKDLASLWYKEIYTKYCQGMPDETVEEIFMQSLAAKGMALKKFPSMTFKQFLEDISKIEPNVHQRLEELPTDIIEAFKKTGVLGSLDEEELW